MKMQQWLCDQSKALKGQLQRDLYSVDLRKQIIKHKNEAEISKQKLKVVKLLMLVGKAIQLVLTF